MLRVSNQDIKLIKGTCKLMVGFMYTFQDSLLSTSSILEQGFSSIHQFQMTSSEEFQQPFSIISEFVCCGFYMKKNIPYSREQKHVSVSDMSQPFQIAYEGDFRSLCTMTFGQKVDFLNSNTCQCSRLYVIQLWSKH